MKFKFVLAFLLLSSTSFRSLAQSPALIDATMVNVRPPSPDVYSFLKFGNTPVGISTGIPEISIPVYNYKNSSTGISTSVSLDYHAGGIRVDEFASSVGLGWALKYGGVISRNIRGIADECSDGYLNTPYFNAQDGNYPFNAQQDKPFVKAANQRVDMQADIFTFDVNGLSGKFTYGRDGQLLLINDSNIKINKETSVINSDIMITKFTLTDANGIIYVFEAYEITTAFGAVTHPMYTSSWHLSYIRYPGTPKVVAFEYEDVTILQHSTSASETFLGNLNPGSNDPDMINSSASDATTYQSKHIKAIRCPNGVTIDFIYDSNLRTDLPNDHLLKKITVSNQYQGSSHGVSLEHDYSLNGRATLLKVKQFGIILPTSTTNDYTFSYNGGLPGRLSNRQDHWGFATNHFENSSGGRIPREIFTSGISGRYEFPGINKDADLNATAGTLNKIIYPTGGYTIFEMEPNQADDGWLNQQFFIPENDPNYKETRSANFPLFNAYSSPYFQDINFTYNEPLPSSGANMKLRIQKTSNSNIPTIRVEVFEGSGSQPMTYIDFNSLSDPTIVKSLTIPGIQQGKSYKLRFYFNFNGTTQNFSGVAYLTYDVNPASAGTQYAHVQPYVGGLRAKSVSDYDGVSAIPVSVKEYQYVEESGDRSSGVLTTYPVYTRTVRYEGVSNYVTSSGLYTYSGGSPTLILRQSMPLYELSYTAGSPVRYKRVVEVQKAQNGTNGKIVRTFYIGQGGTGTVQNFPVVPKQDLDWMYGQLKSEVTYDASGTILKRIDNTYQSYLHPNYSTTGAVNNYVSYVAAPMMFNVPDGLISSGKWLAPQVSSYTPIWYVYNQYLPYAGRTELTKTSTQSFVAGQPSQLNEKSFLYDPDQYQVIAEKTLDSKLRENTITYLYPKDMVADETDANGVYHSMIDSNMLNTLIGFKTSISNSQTNFIRKNYSKFNPSSMLLPSSIETQVSGNPMFTSIKFNKYDNDAHLTEQLKAAGPKQSLIWNADNENVAAVIDNAETPEIFFEDFEKLSLSNLTVGGAHTGFRYASNYTVNWVKPNTRSYLISYWYLNNDKWLYSGLIPYISSTFPLTGGVGYDDIRIHPVDAQMATMTYNPLIGITSSTDAKGQTTYYEYDEFQRLMNLKDQAGNIIKHYDYHFAQ